jgi:PAS domain S-box-containing protein
MIVSGALQMISVLYVDDEEPLLHLGKTFLERYSPDIRVDTAPSAQKALEMLLSGKYDAIVSDYQMPGMDGIALLREIRSGGSNIPFIVFTGKGREEIVIQAINYGADYYLQKGGDPKSQFAELIHQIHQAVAKRRAEEELRESRKRLADIIDFLPDAVFAIDREGRVIAWNRAIEEMTGVSADEMIGKGDREYSIPFYGDRRPILIDYILSQDETIPNHYSLITRDRDVLIAETDLPHPRGERRILFGKASPLYDENGKIVGAIESIRDITDYKWSERRLTEALRQVSGAEERIRASLSELKQREELLRESEKKYETLFHEAADIIILIDTEGRILDFNRKFMEESQRDPEEVTGKDIFSTGLIAPEYHALVAGYLEGIREGRTIPIFEIEGIQKSGKRIPYEVRVSPLVLEGRVTAVQAILRNLTERKAAENALRRSEALYRSVVDNIQDVFYRADMDGILTMASPSFARLLGYSSVDECIGKDLARDFYLDPKEREKFLAALEDAGEVFDYEVTLKRKDGTPVIVSSNSHYFYDEQGKRAGVEGIFRDITENKRIIAALRESETFYRALFENTGTATVVIEEDTTISRVNTQFEKLTGYPREEVEGKKSWTEFVVEEDRGWMLDQHRKRRVDPSGAPTHYEFRVKNRNGEVRFVFLTIVIIPGTKKSIASVLDITDVRNAEAAVRRLNKNLNLLYGVTIHDIANKVTAVQGYLELLQEMNRDTSIDDLIRNALSAIGNIARHIQFARVYQDLGIKEPLWHNLGAVISRHAPGDVPVSISCSGIAVYADQMLEHVFANLFDNSLRHGGNVTSISVECSKSGNDLVVRFRDNGKGIAEADKEKIFEKGYGDHTGYGLFLTREILAITGISIRECGVPGEGVVFEIIVPGGAWRYNP